MSNCTSETPPDFDSNLTNTNLPNGDAESNTLTSFTQDPTTTRQTDNLKTLNFTNNLVTDTGNPSIICEPVSSSSGISEENSNSEPSTNLSINIEPGAETSYPSDPSKVVDPKLLEKLLDLGFDKQISELGIAESIKLRTISCNEGNDKNLVEEAINWIFDHSNQDDYVAEEEVTTNIMGGVGSTSIGIFRGRSCKMVFVVNQSLGMGPGKLAAQVGHAALSLFLYAQRTHHTEISSWLNDGAMKVVLKGKDVQELLDLFKKAKDVGLPAHIIQDAGRTQIPSGSRTVLGIFGPIDVVDQITGSLKLL